MSYLQDDLVDTVMSRYSLTKERLAPLIAEDDLQLLVFCEDCLSWRKLPCPKSNDWSITGHKSPALYLVQLMTTLMGHISEFWVHCGFSRSFHWDCITAWILLLSNLASFPLFLKGWCQGHFLMNALHPHFPLWVCLQRNPTWDTCQIWNCLHPK